jgi:hypothetical protein
MKQKWETAVMQRFSSKLQTDRKRRKEKYRLGDSAAMDKTHRASTALMV